jgi:hypothetical protein
MKRRSPKQILTEETVYAHQDWPNLTTAKYLFKAHPEMFGSVEDARATVRRIRGAKGDDKHERGMNPELVRTPAQIEEARNNPFGFPASDEEEWTFKPLPVKRGTGLVLADIHLPYHDRDALTLITKWAQTRDKVEFILLLGDVNDFYQLSRFEKNPSKRNYLQELALTNQFLDALQEQFPNAQIILKAGNHEKRLPRYIERVGPALWGIEELIYANYLQLKERGIRSYEYDDVLTVGKLFIIHGDEVGGGNNSVNPARGIFLRTLECILEAHHHRTSSHTESTLGGRMITTWSMGCACNLHPRWLRYNKWNHGVVTLRVDGNDFEIDNHRVFKKEQMIR